MVCPLACMCRLLPAPDALEMIAMPTLPPGIPSVWDDSLDDPAEGIWRMCKHLDHLGKTQGGDLGRQLTDAAEYIERHLDALSPPATDD